MGWDALWSPMVLPIWSECKAALVRSKRCVMGAKGMFSKSKRIECCALNNMAHWRQRLLSRILFGLIRDVNVADLESIGPRNYRFQNPQGTGRCEQMGFRLNPSTSTVRPLEDSNVPTTSYIHVDIPSTISNTIITKNNKVKIGKNF